MHVSGVGARDPGQDLKSPCPGYWAYIQYMHIHEYITGAAKGEGQRKRVEASHRRHRFVALCDA
jgi:hypothetical protein